MSRRPAVGRPRATSHEQVRAVARELFREQGYAATSLESIARAAGVSRTTLFAYFPSKGDLLFGELEQGTAALQEALDRRPAGEPIGEGILAALRTAFDLPAEEQDAAAERWEIVDANPDLHSYAAQRMHYQAQPIARFIAARRGEPVTGFLPRVVSEAVMAASASAARYWACTRSATGPMIDYIDAAVRPLLTGYAYDLCLSSVKDPR